MGVNKYNMFCHCEERSNRKDWDCFVVPPRNDILRLIMLTYLPARVNTETGEQFFSPSTVERLQQIIQSQQEPVRTVETPVYDFAA